MAFNLIAARWLPCRRASGTRDWIAPHEITSDFAADPIVALAFPRPDWNAAVTELLIGLYSATMPPADPDVWARTWVTPPTPETLAEALAPLTFAFNLDGDGPRAFQDPTSLEDGKLEPIEEILVTKPADDNRDLFVKADQIWGLSAPYAAAALVTLQTFAPGGGRGHMANPRKKGPLTCVLAPMRQRDGAARTTLWDVVWSNVLDQDDEWLPFDRRSEQQLDGALPWFRLPHQGQPVTSDGLPPFALFLSQPRRLRLVWTSDTFCSFGSTVGPFCAALRTRPGGHQYGSWQHPLSTYRITPDGERKCVQTPEVRAYENWLSMWGLGEGQRPPLALKSWPERLAAVADVEVIDGDPIDVASTRQTGLAAWGFVADRKLEAKVLGFLDERIPYFEPRAGDPKWASDFQIIAAQLIAGAKETASSLKYSLRLNTFAKWDGEKRIYKLLDNAPKDAFDDLAAMLWSATQTAFVEALGKAHAGDVTDADKPIRKDFLAILRTTALRLFDEAANIDTLADQNARRLVEARRGLVIALSAEGRIAVEMKLVDAKPKGKGGKGKK